MVLVDARSLSELFSKIAADRADLIGARDCAGE